MDFSPNFCWILDLNVVVTLNSKHILTVVLVVQFRSALVQISADILLITIALTVHCFANVFVISGLYLVLSCVYSVVF